MREKLRRARLDARLTQAEVARRIGKTKAAYSLIERGERNVYLDTAVAIARAIGRPVNELFDGMEVNSNNTDDQPAAREPGDAA